MQRRICHAVLAAMLFLAGCQSTPDPSKPLDQSKIISVKPAIPDGARKFVEQQNRLEQQRQRKSKTQAGQPAGYTYVEPVQRRPASGNWTDIFNPAKWGKGKQSDMPPQHPAATSQPGA